MNHCRKAVLLWIVMVVGLTLSCRKPTAPSGQGPTILWTRTYGGAGNDEGKSIQQTSDRGYIMTGWTQSFGHGSADVYLIKINAQGNVLWSKTYGGSSGDASYSIQQTSDGGYIIAGSTSSFGSGNMDVYLIKTDENGIPSWTKTYGGLGGDVGFSVQQTSDGGYIVTGHTNSFGSGNTDVYLIKTDGNGNASWSKTYGGFEGDWGHEVQQTSDGGYIIAGYSESFGAGSTDVYLIKTDENGDTLWTRTYGGEDWDFGLSVQQTSDGEYIITGCTYSFGSGNNDVYLMRIDANGDTLWTKTYGGDLCEEGYSVRETYDGGYIITGYSESFGPGLVDVYIIKTDENGDSIWTKTCGGADPDIGYSVQLTSDGGYIVAGKTFSFGAGSFDVYVIKIKE